VTLLQLETHYIETSVEAIVIEFIKWLVN